MVDDFLKQYRKQPDQAFTQALYRKIHMEPRPVSTMKRLSLALVCLLAIFGIALGVSPQARGAALELIREVGGLRFTETNDYPGNGGKEEIVESRHVPFDEAILIFPGTISLPRFLPEGYSLDPEVRLTDFGGGSLPMAEVTWKTNPNGGWSNLRLGINYLTEEFQGYAEVVGEGAIEEVTINGKPAALIRGGWNYDTKSFDPNINNLSLQWEYDERTIYALHSSESIGQDVLIEIAESIP